jgi:signal peptidase II
MSPKLRTVLGAIAIIVPLDQLTKWWVASSIPRYGWIEVIEGFFRITHARNTGAAFGFGQGLPIWVFVALTVVALWMILRFYQQIDAQDRLSALALGLVVAGALGNLIDRVWHHEVIDFLQFNFQIFIFPDFNVADSAIVIGVGLLLLDVVTQEAEESGAGAEEPEEPV